MNYFEKPVQFYGSSEQIADRLSDELGGSRKERVNHWEPEWVNQIRKERVAENVRGREREYKEQL